MFDVVGDVDIGLAACLISICPNWRSLFIIIFSTPLGVAWIFIYSAILSQLLAKNA